MGIEEMPMMVVMIPRMGWGMAGAEGKGRGGVAKEEEKTSFDLTLKGGFDAAVKIKIIKEVRAVTDLVEKTPALLKKGVAKVEAEKIIEKLKAVGAKVTME